MSSPSKVQEDRFYPKPVFSVYFKKQMINSQYTIQLVISVFCLHGKGENAS